MGNVTALAWALSVVSIALAAVCLSLYRLRGPVVHTAPLEAPNDSALLRRCEDDKRYAYYERNLAICAFAKWVLANGGNAVVGTANDPHFKSWSTALYIEADGFGQQVWHFHDDHAWMVQALGVRPYPGAWDGRTKDQRYSELESWVRIPAPGYSRA